MMDYADAYIKAFQSLRDTYYHANEKDFATAEQHAIKLVAAAQALLQDIQNKK